MRSSQQVLAGAGVPHWLWLPVVLGVFLATGALRSVLRRKQTMLGFATMTRAELELSRRVYERVVKAQWGFLVRQRAGPIDPSADGGVAPGCGGDHLAAVADQPGLPDTAVSGGCAEAFLRR